MANEIALVLGFNKTRGRECQASMDTEGGGSSTPSYSYMVANKGRGGKRNKPPQPLDVKTKYIETQKAKASKTNADQGGHKEDCRGEKEEDICQGQRIDLRWGPIKPRPQLNLRLF